MEMVDYALAYAAKGLTIFPVWWIDGKGRCACGVDGCSAGKHPIISGGFKHASREPEVVKNWFKKWPQANIGCLPGASGCVVIDVDGPEGAETARGLGLLSEPTLEVQSGREDGGRHRWYKHPGGHIANGKLGKGIDVRADAGYVILPPSRHASGRTYQWLGRWEEMAELPEAIGLRLQQAAMPAPTNGADVIALTGVKDELLEGFAEGGRNNGLARYAGRLFAKGLTLPEVQMALLGANQAACRPPLPVQEVLTVARSIHAAEVRSGVVRTPPSSPAVAVSEPNPTETLENVRADALRGAVAILDRDPAQAVRWSLPSLDQLAGAMLPGELHVVGAIPGNGKTALVMTQIESLRQKRVPVLYAPLEIDPSIALLREAAFLLGVDVAPVLRGEWFRLPDGTKREVELLAQELAIDPTVSFVPTSSLDLAGFRLWVRKAKDEMGAKVVVIDHFHRMQPVRGRDVRIGYNELIQQMTNTARELEVVLLCTVQLNRLANEALDRYRPPTMERIKETASVGEEASSVLTLSRALKASVSDAEFKAVKNGQVDVSTIAAPNVMVATLRKCRLDDGSLLDRSVRMTVKRGAVVESIRDARDNPDWIHA